ncbi:MAG: GAF domain-containing protein [Acidobacteriota bacterium]
MARREAGGQRVDRGSVLLSVARLVGEPVDLDHLLSRVMEAVIRAMDADRGTLFLLDRARGEIWSRAGRLPPGPEIRLPVGTGIAGHVARTGRRSTSPIRRRIPASTATSTG